MLGVLEAGEQVGTVSGGCVEEDLLERIGAGEFSGESPKLVEYGVSALENERLGLPCGGKLVLLIEQLNTGDSTYRLVAHALSPGKIVTPVYLGQRGHPVGFDQGYFHTLKNLCGDEGARKLINANWIQLTCAWAL